MPLHFSIADRFPITCFRDHPLINRGYAIIDQALQERADRFAEVEADPEVPRRYHIYVRRVQRADRRSGDSQRAIASSGSQGRPVRMTALAITSSFRAIAVRITFAFLG